MKLSRAALLLSTLVFVCALIWVALTAGDEIPAHFSGAGQIDRMESKSSFLLTIGGIGVALIGAFASIRWWFPKLPAQFVNLPTRRMHEYWTSEKNRPELNRKATEDLDWIGAACSLLLSWMVVISGTATQDSVNVWMLVVPIALFMFAILGYTVFIIKGGRYRVPKD